MKQDWTRTSLSIAMYGLMAAVVAGCGGPSEPLTAEDMRDKGLGLTRVAEMTEFLVAYELKSSCKLQRAPNGPDASPPTDYAPLKPNELASQSFEVHGRRFHTNADGRLDSIELRVSQKDGPMFWLRNVPTTSVEEIATSWRCVVSPDWVKEQAPKTEVRAVELSPRSSECSSLIPIAGTTDDVTFAPYTVTGGGVYAGTPPAPQIAKTGGQGAIAVGVRLEADGGEKSLLVPSRVLDSCFVPATHVPPKPSEAKALLDWLTGANPEAVPPPSVALETIQTVAGLDPAGCIRSGSGATEHLECRSPLLRVNRSQVAGPFGPPTIEFTRERFVDSIHLYGGKLIPASEIIGVTALVRIPKLAREGTFAKVFQDALRASIADPVKEHARGSRGFRVVGATNPGEPAAKATHFIDIDLHFDVPEAETSTETRSHKYVAGKKRVPNPEYDKAVKALEEATADVPNAEAKARLAEQALATGEAACNRGASQLGWLAGTLAKGACGVTSSAAVTAARNSVAAAKERLAKATASLAETPKEVDVDDEREWKYEARIVRRRGAATAKLSITTHNQVVQYTGNIEVPFDASDVEVPDDAEHKLVGKKAKTPTQEEVERALAQALVPRIDEAIIKWGAQRQVGGDIGNLRPGSRSWMVAVARRASNDRPIKLLSDILENRSERLSGAEIVFPVKIPARAAPGCFTLAAIPTGGGADVNLEFGRKVTESRFLAIARDARKDSDAGIEVCNLSAGEYAVRVFYGDEKRSTDGVLISLFDSTPGALTNEDTVAAARGIPTMPRKGQSLVLDGAGETRFEGSAGRVVVGKTGDRDGDGVLDDDDRCPYDQETKNRYLDEDGCPDVPPAGWKPPAEPAPASAPAASGPKTPEAKKPESRPPDTRKPEAKKPESKKPESKKPDAKKPESKKPSVFIP